MHAHQRVMNRCDRLGVSLIIMIRYIFCSVANTFVSAKFPWCSERYLLSPKLDKKVIKWVTQIQRCIIITKMSDTSIVVIYHVMSHTLL